MNKNNNDNDKRSEAKMPANAGTPNNLKKKYSKPRLMYYGGIKDLTHSSTAIGTGDSGNPGTRRP